MGKSENEIKSTSYEGLQRKQRSHNLNIRMLSVKELFIFKVHF